MKIPSWLKKVSKIDDKTKLTVYGWMRQKQNSFNLSHVPMLITSMCILYFHDDEIFEIAIGYVISQSGKCITQTNQGGEAAYGSIKIASKSDTICQWDLKVSKPESKLCDIIFGVACIENADRFEYCNAKGIRYAFCKHEFVDIDGEETYHQWKKYKNNIKHNDKVSLRLNLK